jgi:uncharacterized protein involved in exopolysaccharide biosynthesis
VRDGLPTAGRYRRYAVAVLPPIIGIWFLTFSYVRFAPKSFTSNFVMILPGSGMGGTLNVESIGQAQGSAASAFSSTTLSPTENYKRLLMSDVTLRSAARVAHVDPLKFPDPTVKTIDQTNLIQVAIEGKSAQQAVANATALRDSFLGQLDKLRADEAVKREASDLRHLKELEIKAREAEHKLLDFQAANGLVSIEQFNSRIASIDALRERERETRTTLREQSAETSSYKSDLGTGIAPSNATLRLKSDPDFQKLLERYAQLDSDAAQKSATLGSQHGELVQANSERDTVRAALLRRGQQLTGLDEHELMRRVDLSVSDGRSSMMQALVVSHVHQNGTSASLAEIRSDLAKKQAAAGRLVTLAAELGDLTRANRVAEAVFSSALARIDTNKQDPFASYPLVQTLEEPSVPRSPSAPSPKIAYAGAVGATLLLLIGFGLVWLRQPLIRKLFPNA